ncbi:MAG: LpxD N-terminal domain-containing protein [candidate division NC10 bacterium]
MTQGGPFTLGQLAEALGATLEGDPARPVGGVAPLERAGPNEVSFLLSRRYQRLAEETRAGAVVAPADATGLPGAVLRVASPQAALITLDAAPDRRYRGVVRQIVPAVDRQKAVVQTKIKFLDPDDRLVPDMSARVSFLTQEVSAEAASAPPRIFIPAAVIRTQGDLSFVLVVKEDKASLMKVLLGESRGELREVVGGLTGQESLIEGGGEEIQEGDRVRIAS